MANLPWIHLILLENFSLIYRKILFFSNLQIPILRHKIIAFWLIYAYWKLCSTDLQFRFHLQKCIHTSFDAIFKKNSDNANWYNTRWPGCKLFNTAAHFHCVFGKINYPVYKVESCKCNWEENPRILVYFTGASQGWREWWGSDRCWR